MIMYGGQKQETEKHIRELCANMEELVGVARQAVNRASALQLEGSLSEARTKLNEARSALEGCLESRAEIMKHIAFGATMASTSILLATMPAYESTRVLVDIIEREIIKSERA